MHYQDERILTEFTQDIQVNIRQLAMLALDQETLDASIAKLAKSKGELEKQIVMRNELLLEQEVIYS